MSVRVWTPTESNDWHDPYNWEEIGTFGVGVPQSADTARIVGDHVVSNAAAFASRIDLEFGARLTTTANMTVGVQIYIRPESGGSTLEVLGGVLLAPTILAGGLLRVSGGATVTASTIQVGREFDGSFAGSVIVGGASPASAGTINGNIAFVNATSSLTFRTTDAAAYGGNISGAGSVTIDSAGQTTTFSGNSSAHSGTLLVNAGALALSGAGSLSGSSIIQLNGTGSFDISAISAASTTVRYLYMRDAGTQVILGGKTLTVSEANQFVGPGSFAGSAGADAVVFNVATADFTLAGPNGAVFTNWTAGQDSITINGNASANTLTGDELQATTINGGAGNDRIVIHNGSGSYDGGADSDTLVVSSTMILTGNIAGFEAVELSAGANLTLTSTQFATGLASNMAVSGTGTITVNMSMGVGFLASDMSFASTVATVVNGTSGIDIIKLGTGASTGNIVNGGDGVDQIRGSNGVDTIDGGIGNDKIMALGGADVLTGGAGNDQFRYLFTTDSGIGTEADRILDFISGEDRFNFGFFDADPNTAGRQALSFIGTAAFATNGTAQLRYADSGADTLVQIDLNGDGAADMEIVLAGHAGQALTGTDFLF